MDAALITRMFNVGYSVKNEPPKDVLVKKDSDFKDVLSKNMKDVKNEDDKVSADVKKKDDENIGTVKDENIEEKDVKRKDKDKKDEKKVSDSEENKTEKINGLIEQRLENVKNEQDVEVIVKEVEKIDLEIKDVDLQDKINEGLIEKIDEVGPQSVETEKITLNKEDENKTEETDKDSGENSRSFDVSLEKEGITEKDRRSLEKYG